MDQGLRLFKYFPPERVDVLRSGRICFSSPLNLNDPFELKPPIQLFESAEEMAAALSVKIDREMQSNPPDLPPDLSPELKGINREQFVELLRGKVQDRIPDLIARLMPAVEEGIERFYSSADKRIGVLCLTEFPDNLLMWAHYAGAHAGFVVEFDPSHSFFNQQRSDVDELRYLRPIIYSSERPILTLSTARDISTLLTKSTHWEYEKEWRMMVDLNDASEIKVVGDNAYHLFGFPRESIRSVILGCRMSESVKHDICQALSFFEGRPPDLYQSETCKKKFVLNFSKIQI